MACSLISREKNSYTRLYVLTKYGATACKNTRNSQTSAGTSLKRGLGGGHKMLAEEYSGSILIDTESLCCASVVQLVKWKPGKIDLSVTHSWI